MEKDEIEIRFSFKKPVPGTTETLNLIRAEVYRRLKRLEAAETLLTRALGILPRLGEPSKVLGPHADPVVFDQLAHDIGTFLEESS
jgi:hypothetical protein